MVNAFQTHQAELELQRVELDKLCRELKEICEGYAQLYHSGTTGYLTVSVDGRILHANAASAAILDCPLETLIHKQLGQFICPSDRDAFLHFIRSLATPRPGQEVLTVRFNARRKEPFPLRCNGLSLADCTQQTCCQDNVTTYGEFRLAVNGRIVSNHHICLALNDVTEREFMQNCMNCFNKKLEDKIFSKTRELIASNRVLQKQYEELYVSKMQLREREARLNAVFNAANEGIATVDKSGLIASANSAMETIFGFSRDELIGRPIKTVIPARIENNALRLDKSVQSIGGSGTFDGIRKDGATVPLDISLAEFLIDGNPHFTLIFRDVSLRLLKEQEDRAHLDQLAHVTRLGLMGEMASGIAHEINQPLAAITGYSQACLNYLQTDQPDLAQLRQVLQKTHEQALRAGHIINRMREFVSYKTVHRAEISVNALIGVCLDLCFSDLKANNVDPRLDLAKALPAICGDRVQIEQVLLNLIRNSLESLQNQPEDKPRILTIQTSLDDNNHIVVRVKDNGPGIDRTEQEKILTPFFTTKQSGMGMGLSICQSIIKAHAGILSFNSMPGKGATFYFTLPIQEP